MTFEERSYSLKAILKTDNLKTFSPISRRSQSEKARKVWIKRSFMTLRSTKKLTVPQEFKLSKSRKSYKEEKEIDFDIQINIQQDQVRPQRLVNVKSIRL